MKLTRTLVLTIFTVFAAATAYSGDFENDRAYGGTKFGESVIGDQIAPITLEGDFKSVPKAALSADLKQTVPGITVPAPLPPQITEEKPGLLKRIFTKERIQMAVINTWLSVACTIICLGIGIGMIATFTAGLVVKGIYLAGHYAYKKWGPSAA